MLKARTGTQDLNFSGEHLFKVQNWASYYCLRFSWLFNFSFGFFCLEVSDVGGDGHAP